MKLKDIKLNKRRYSRSNWAPNEFCIVRFIGKEWVVAENQDGKEVVFCVDGVADDEWKFFDDEILYPEEDQNGGRGKSKKLSF